MFKNGEEVCTMEKECQGRCQKKDENGKILQKCAFCRVHKEHFLRETNNR